MFFLGWFLSNHVSDIALNKINALVRGNGCGQMRFSRMEAETSLRNRIQARQQECGACEAKGLRKGTHQFCAVKGPGELEWHGVPETKTGFVGVSDQAGESSLSCLVGDK